MPNIFEPVPVDRKTILFQNGEAFELPKMEGHGNSINYAAELLYRVFDLAKLVPPEKRDGAFEDIVSGAGWAISWLERDFPNDIKNRRYYNHTSGVSTGSARVVLQCEECAMASRDTKEAANG